jgi:hypothetical protein
MLADYEADYGVITPEELASREREDRRSAVVIRGSAKSSARKRRSKAA